MFCGEFPFTEINRKTVSLAFFVIYIQARDSTWVGRKKRKINKDEKPIVKETEKKDTTTVQLPPSVEHLKNV